MLGAGLQEKGANQMPGEIVCNQEPWERSCGNRGNNETGKGEAASVGGSSLYDICIPAFLSVVFFRNLWKDDGGRVSL